LHVRTILYAIVAAAVLGVGCSQSPPMFATPREPGSPALVHRDVQATTHLLTWINADHANPAPDWSSVRPYLDFALVGQSVRDVPLAQAIAAGGIGVVPYTNPNHQAQDGKPHFPDDQPQDFAHDCQGARIYRIGYGLPTPPPGPPPTPTDYTTYLMDPHSTHLAQSWADEVTAFVAQTAVTPAYVFEDTADSIRSSNAAPCRYSEAGWTAASIGLDQNMIADAAAAGESVSIVYNGLGTSQHPNPSRTPQAFGLNVATSGGMAENCYSRQPASTPNDPDPPPEPAHGSQWLATENIELDMAAAHKLFVCNANSSAHSAAEGQAPLRTYVIASVLLTYDPATTILDEEFKPSSGFEVFPESSIVALQPLAPAPTDISGLDMGGVYARQYAMCYVGGKPIGSCAAVVNPSVTATYPFPFSGTYTGTLKIVGGGVLDVGARIKFVSGMPVTIAPRSAAIAFAAAPSPTP
jgi:hypothetical protein